MRLTALGNRCLILYSLHDIFDCALQSTDSTVNMALVGYSDSEGSDTEVVAKPAKVSAVRNAKASVQPVIDPSAPRKIKVDLPSLPTEDIELNDRPAKKARTSGGFGGFNSLLPAPKRAADAKKSGLSTGVSLKTSSEAAFSRAPAEEETPEWSSAPFDESSNATDHVIAPAVNESEQKPEGAKPAGNAMRFKPLSVANKKKPKKKSAVDMQEKAMPAAMATTAESERAAPRPPKPKVPLFSAGPEAAVSEAVEVPADTYEDEEPVEEEVGLPQQISTYSEQTNQDPNSLSAIATDLNLTEAQRRQLFGRKGQDVSAIKIANFNMDTEYAINEEARAAGETIEHRALKAVAPGKHSLQQLVNSANTQREALEDAWAAGKRSKTEGGNKYGWTR